MFRNHKVIDVHGHISAPSEFWEWGTTLFYIRGMMKDPYYAVMESVSDERLDTALSEHIGILNARNIDVQMLSPRPAAMFHMEALYIQEAWCRSINNLIAQSCRLYPDRFVGIAMLPQNAQTNTRNCLPELERCVHELGFVGVIVNPDPGADGNGPAMHEEYWYPLYDKAQQLKVPLLIHPSGSRHPKIDNGVIPHNYQINSIIGELLATLSFEHGPVFELFPDLIVIVCHCGGVLNRFIKTDLVHAVGTHPRAEKNLFYDTCAYDVDFLTAAIKQRGVARMVFGSEAPGSGMAIRPDTGRPSNDLVPVIDSLDFLTEEDKIRLFNSNVRQLFPRLDPRLVSTPAEVGDVIASAH